jgi:hypothetical protein
MQGIGQESFEGLVDSKVHAVVDRAAHQHHPHVWRVRLCVCARARVRLCVRACTRVRACVRACV